VGDAAINQQHQMLQSFVGFAHHISSASRRENATWPYFRIPDFELHGGQAQLQSGAEVIGCVYLVHSEDEGEYLNYITNNYVDSLNEAHMTLYGSLNHLEATGYTKHFTVIGADSYLIQSIARSDIRTGKFLRVSTNVFVLISLNFMNTDQILSDASCPATVPAQNVAYSSYVNINWDPTGNVPEYPDFINAVIALKNGSVT
jgi:hypothetical protein